MNDKKSALNRLILRRLGRIIMNFTRSAVGWRAKAIAGSLLLLMLGINGMNVINSYVGRDFMSAIEKRNMHEFARYAILYVAVFAGSTVLAVFFRFAEERLGLLWRGWLTHRAVMLYMDQRVYLHVEASGSLTNPDQRMTEDIRQLTTSTLSFVLMIFNGVVTIISFSGVLWAISPMLFIVSVLYAILGSAMTVWLGRPLIRLNYQQSDLEANFRSELIRTGEHAEGIALTGNQNTIRDRILARIDQLVANFRIITAVNRNVNFFTTGYNYLIQLIPALFVAPLFINGTREFGVIGQSAMAFTTLVAAFSLIVTQFQAITAYASVTTRLSEFMDAIERSDTINAASCIGCNSTSDHFIYRDLTLRTTDEEKMILVKNLSASLVRGRRVRIYGANQNAWLALFHASAGIYDSGSGNIERPPPKKTAFLPEQPFVPTGSIREILAPNHRGASISDEDIEKLFAELGLASSKFKTRAEFHVPRDWHDAISLKKLQILSVARAVLTGPDFVFLDRLESSISGPALQQVLSVLSAHGITVISFGEEGPDPALHDAGLEFKADGTWVWTELR